MKRDRVYNLLATLSLILAGLVLIYYSIVFFIPQSPINPFQPIEIPIAAVPIQVSATDTPEATIIPIVTSEPSLTPTTTQTPTPTLAQTQTSTQTLTLTSTISSTPAFTSTARSNASSTLTPDICTTLKLLGPRSGQHYSQNDNADLTWSFGRALAADEHFDILFDPPGQGINSLVWADEVQPELKNCTTRCIYEVGLGRYPGGRFNWTIGVIKAGSDHQVAAQICKPPDPFNFTYLTLQ